MGLSSFTFSHLSGHRNCQNWQVGERVKLLLLPDHLGQVQSGLDFLIEQKEGGRAAR